MGDKAGLLARDSNCAQRLPTEIRSGVLLRSLVAYSSGGCNGITASAVHRFPVTWSVCLHTTTAPETAQADRFRHFKHPSLRAIFHEGTPKYMQESRHRYRDTRDEVVRVGLTLVSIAVLVAIAFLYIEVIHNVFRIEEGIVSAAGSILILPIVLAVIGLSYFFIHWYRKSYEKLRLGRRFLIATGIELAVLGLSLLLRLQLLMLMLNATREGVIVLLGRSPDILIYGSLGLGVAGIVAGSALVVRYRNRRRKNKRHVG